MNITFWCYIASVLPAILIVAYGLGRMGYDQRTAGNAALVIGAFWPLMLPVVALVWLVEQAFNSGVAEYKARNSDDDQ